MFNLFRHCRKDEISFDVAKTGNIVSKNGNIVAKNGNNVEATFDFLKRTKFYDKLVRFLATKSNIASTLLPVASTLFAGVDGALLITSLMHGRHTCLYCPFFRRECAK